jgi:PAS domain S-box-containing protein
MIAAHTKPEPDFLAGAGEMGARIRQLDWAGTPLGAIEFWPQSLKTSVSLILTSRHPMWIGWGPEMTFLYNDAYLHVLGSAKHPRALGRPAPEVWAEIWDICGPLATKVLTRGEASFVDDVRLFMDRGDFLEETFYSFSYSPIRDESGQVSGLFCPSTDVTPKVLNARRLETLSKLATNALEAKTAAGACAVVAGTLAKNPDDIPFALLYLLDPEGKSASIEQVVGPVDNALATARTIELDSGSDTSLWNLGEVVRTCARRIVPISQLAGFPPGVAGQRLAQAVVLPVTSRSERKPYGVLVAGVNPCRPLDPGHLTFFDLLASQAASAIQNARAVEDEKRRADMLAELDRAKTVFFSNVSHEFRTPLTLMLGPLESMLARQDGIASQDREQLLIAHRNSLRLLKLVNSLLDFSRIEAGRIEAFYAPVDLSRLTADLTANFRSAMDAAGLELIVDCPPLPEPVYVDLEMWEKIVLNLLSNAFKFTFEGSVTVRLRSESRNAVLTVSDTGTGIPEAELPRIFERFHRIEGARARTYEGTGIGLALIQELVRLHGGSISADSRLAEGSRFTVTMPFGSAHLPRERVIAGAAPSTAVRVQAYTEEALTWLSHTGQTGAPAEPESGTARARVLIADDNADMREYVTRILGQDYELVLAGEGHQALELIRQRHPDLVLTDVMMPGLDGFGLLRALRDEPSMKTIPVIVISARAGEEARVHGLEAGADDYLVKPFTANELIARVSTHLRMAYAHRRIAEQEAVLRTEAEAARDEIVRVLESVTDGFIALDRDWRIAYANAETERLNGMRREEMVGRNYWELFPAAVGTATHREFLRAAADRVPVEFENCYEPWNRWFHVKAFPAGDGGLSVFFEDITARKIVEQERAELLRREHEAREEAETLNEVSRHLAGQLDLEKVVQTATDAATKLTGAEFGAFYNVADKNGESCTLFTASGIPSAAFEEFPLPRKTFSASRIVRTDDVLQDPNSRSVVSGHLPVRSYLAVPAMSRSGEVLGGFFFGHSRTSVFTERGERLAAGIAGHAAIAIENARLFAKAEREIARRNAVEKALRENEQRFREMIDALPAAIYTTDAEGRLTHFNPAAVRLSGRVPELGTDRWSITSKLFLADGTPLPHDACPMATAVKEGRIVSGGEYIAERPDGSRFWFTPYPTPLRNGDGRIVGGINMLVDITNRKGAEEALRRSEERFRGVFESSAIGVAILSVDEHFLQANKAFCSITGYSEEELRATNFGALMHRDESAAVHEHIRHLVSGEVPTFVLENRYFTKDGRTIWVQNSVSAMRDAGGRPEHLIVLCEDVSTRKQAETAIRESEERFRAIVDTTPECVKVVAEDGTLLMMNSSGLEMIGAPAPEAAVGKSIYDLIAPEFRDQYREFNDRICKGEKGGLEFDIVGLRGRRRQMQTYAAPFRNSGGGIAQLGITHDITERKHAERADLLLAAIVESSDDAIVSKDLNGIITSWNKGAERLFGYTAEEVVGESITIIIPPDRLGEEPHILSRLRRGERVDHFETIRRRKDGTLLNVSLTISPIKDAHGKVIGASKIARDVTESKRAEAAIQKLNEQLAAELVAMTRLQALSTRLVQADDFPVLLGEILDAALEITHAQMGNVQLFDDDVLRIVCQRGFEEPFLAFFQSVKQGRGACGTALERGERIIVDDVAASELFAGTPSLEVILASGGRALQSTPLITRAGEVLGVFSTYYRSPHRPGERDLRMLDLLARQAADLIERKRAEAALLASEGRFRQLADSMPQMVWTARPEGYVDYFNERWYEFTGFARDKFGDMSWEPILHPDDVKPCHEAWYASVRTGEPFRIEYRFWDRGESRWRWFMGRALPVRNQRDEIVKWFGSCTDIDEQKRVEDELRRANYDLEQFAYSASHDLQEPLRGVKIYSELLSKRYAARLEGEALDFLKYLRGSATRMEMLVRDLLAYTQVGRLEPPEHDADANQALRETLANLDGAIVESGARITSDPLPPVHAHDTHLKQLFQNLVGNAIKYRSRKRVPLIHVNAERRDGHWRFTVSDNGIGIEPQYKERIFGLFKRLHAGDEYSGTGIGLAICQRIVERYHGRIWVESEFGQGSRFIFTLPV